MIHVLVGELALQDVEALVRPIRSDFAPVTALSRDLLRAAGDDLVERVDRMGPLPIGGAVLTPAGALTARYLIHAVVMSEDEPQTSWSIQRALRNVLRRASDWGLESLALPALGVGAGSMEPESAARALVEVLFDHLAQGGVPTDLKIVVGSDFESQLFTRLVDEASRLRSPTRN